LLRLLCPLRPLPTPSVQLRGRRAPRRAPHSAAGDVSDASLAPLERRARDDASAALTLLPLPNGLLPPAGLALPTLLPPGLLGVRGPREAPLSLRRAAARPASTDSSAAARLPPGGTAPPAPLALLLAAALLLLAAPPPRAWLSSDAGSSSAATCAAAAAATTHRA
jgi:hypothetical protein